MSAGTRAAAQKASLQQRLADRDGSGGDGTSEPGPRQEKTPKINESSETALVCFAKTN